MGNSSLFGSDDELDESEEDNARPTISQKPSEVLPQPTGKDATAPAGQTLDDIASLNAPDITGFYLFRDLVPLQMQESLLHRILEEKAVTAEHPQAMLFPRSSESGRDIENCPSFLSEVVASLPRLLQTHLPDDDYQAVFEENLPLQTIINLYAPGQGITPHVSAFHITVDYD